MLFKTDLKAANSFLDRKKCNVVFRIKNLHQQLTFFLAFGSQTLKLHRKDWRFLHRQVPDHKELDRLALATWSPPSNAKNSAGGAINASIIEEKKSHSGVDTLSTILHLERWIQILQWEGQGIQSPAAMWERRKMQVSQTAQWRQLARSGFHNSAFLWLATLEASPF